TRPRAYTPADRDWLVPIARQAAIFMRNAHLHAEAQRLADELRLINRISSVVNASLDLPSILHQICQMALQLTNAQKALILLHQGETLTLVPAHQINLTRAGEAILATTTLPLEHAWTQRLESGQPVNLPDVTGQTSFVPLDVLFATEGIHSVTLVPLMSLRSIVSETTFSPHRDLVGLLLIGFTTPHSPANGILELLGTVANQAAVAIENAHLFDETQNAVKRLAYLAEATRIFTRSLELSEVTHSVVTWIVDALELDFGALTLWSGDHERLAGQAFTTSPRVPAPVNEAVYSFAPSTVPEVEEMLQRRWARVYNAGEPGASPAMQQLQAAAGLRVLILVPLMVRDEVIGLLLLGLITDRVMQTNDVNLAEAIAGQAAAAIQNAQFYSLTENALADRLTEISALEQVLQRISASVDEDFVIREVLTAAQTVTEADLLDCALRSETGDWRVMWRLADEPALRILPIAGLTRSIVTRVYRSGQYALVHDTNDDPDYLQPEGWPLTRSELAVPIVYENEALGVIDVEAEATAAFTPYHLRFLQNLAHHAANAIMRARLFTARQRQIDMLEGIRVLSVDLLDNVTPDVLLARVCETALGIAHGLNAHIYFYDDTTDALTFAASLWHDGRRNVEAAPPRPQGMTRRGIAAGKPLVSAEFQPVPGVSTRQLGVFPLHHHGRIVGALNIAVSDPAHLDEEAVRALDLLANQAAVAIERARLFASRQRELEMLNALRELSLRLLNALDRETVLELVCRTALTIVGAQDVTLYFYDADNDTLEFAASLWADGRRNLESWEPRPQGVTRRTARSGQPTILRDSERIYEGTGEVMQAVVLGIPLKDASQVVGVLNVAVANKDTLSEDEISILELLANQAATAVRNVGLYEAVRDARDRMQVILNTVRDGLALVDRRNVLMQVNPALSAMLGHEMPPFVGQDFVRVLAQLAAETPALAEAFSEEALQELLGTLAAQPDGLTHRALELVLHEDQHRYFVEESTPVLAEDGELIGRLFIWRDTTHAHDLEQARSELTYTIVHDLRSPLTAIKGGISMLRELGYEATDAALLEEVLSVAENSADGLLALVESLLDVARLESGDLPLDRVAAPLAAPVDQAVSLLNVLAREAGVTLRADLPPDLPHLSIDVDQIRRVFINLIDNALRYTPAGGHVTVQAAVAADGVVEARVIDNGPGVQADARERIFEPYQTGVTKAPRRGTKGLGLGLTFCKLSIEAHGGRIWVDNGPEGGAAFCFTLPIATDTSMMQ
ncbi:MAG: GAF domain-containing protein, partial [Anaerolineae bacterium]|nr:GAF domain-containing protein [Anaerolineae bacterium]